MTKKKTPLEENIQQVELQKMAFKEAANEFLEAKWDKVLKNVGKWFLHGLILFFFAGFVKLFFWLIEKGYIKWEDIKT
ncbi:MAG: hypothetical protein KGL39_38855 [Patescibacteria group bacterium]|nr:hypothetical protein [Patescibacteria group bacterium]